MTLKELRSSKSLTQKAAAALCSIPLRTYVRYENNPDAEGSLKYQYLIQKISQYGFVDENHGVLSKDDIVRSCNLVFQTYPVEYCYLFGSYAKGLVLSVPATWYFRLILWSIAICSDLMQKGLLPKQVMWIFFCVLIQQVLSFMVLWNDLGKH